MAAGSGELETLESIDVVRHFLQKCRYFVAVSLLDNTHQPPVNYSGALDAAVSYDVALSVFDIQPRECSRRHEKRVSNASLIESRRTRIRGLFGGRKNKKK